MRDDRYHPRQLDEIDGPGLSLLNEPLPPENVGVLTPRQRRSLHSLVAQGLADTEALIARLEAGVAVADSGRALVRDLYVGCRSSAKCWQRS
jgi:hypothetical protein